MSRELNYDLKTLSESFHHIYNESEERKIKRYNILVNYLNSGGDPNAILDELISHTSNKKTILMIACSHNLIDIVKLLLSQRTINVNQGDLFNKPALHYAISEVFGDPLELIALLLKNFARVNAKDSSNNSALKLAVLTENLKIVKLLLKHGADIDSEDWDKCTPLMNAIHNINSGDIKEDIVVYLLENGADPRHFVKDSQDFTRNKKQLYTQKKKLWKKVQDKLGPQIIEQIDKLFEKKPTKQKLTLKKTIKKQSTKKTLKKVK